MHPPLEPVFGAFRPQVFRVGETETRRTSTLSHVATVVAFEHIASRHARVSPRLIGPTPLCTVAAYEREPGR